MDKLLLAAITLAGAAVLSGCVATTPELDARFGEAVRQARLQQTLHPEASRDTRPVTGLDGKAAKEAMDNYRDSFRTPPPDNSVTLNIGAGVTGR